MGGLTIDLVADLIVLVRQKLADEGWTGIELIPDDNVLRTYFDALRRRLPIQRRRVWLSDTFSCPKGLEQAFRALTAKIEAGEDLNSHLSHRHRSIHNLDGMLNDWDVHHLHLGNIPSQKHIGYIERTAEIVYARVAEKDLYVIGIAGHKDFANPDIFDTLHRNWPFLLEHLKLRGVAAEQISPTQRHQIRRVNGNLLTQSTDGETYFSLSGGICPDGRSFAATKLADRFISALNSVQTALQNNVTSICATPSVYGNAKLGEITAKLIHADLSLQSWPPRFVVQFEREGKVLVQEYPS